MLKIKKFDIEEVDDAISKYVHEKKTSDDYKSLVSEYKGKMKDLSPENQKTIGTYMRRQIQLEQYRRDLVEKLHNKDDNKNEELLKDLLAVDNKLLEAQINIANKTESSFISMKSIVSGYKWLTEKNLANTKLFENVDSRWLKMVGRAASLKTLTSVGLLTASFAIGGGVIGAGMVGAKIALRGIGTGIGVESFASALTISNLEKDAENIKSENSLNEVAKLKSRFEEFGKIKKDDFKQSIFETEGYKLVCEQYKKLLMKDMLDLRSQSEENVRSQNAVLYKHFTKMRKDNNMHNEVVQKERKNARWIVGSSLLVAITGIPTISEHLSNLGVEAREQFANLSVEVREQLGSVLEKFAGSAAEVDSFDTFSPHFSGSYEVIPGDTVWGILKSGGMTDRDIAELIRSNPSPETIRSIGISSGNWDDIKPGERINLDKIKELYRS